MNKFAYYKMMGLIKRAEASAEGSKVSKEDSPLQSSKPKPSILQHVLDFALTAPRRAFALLGGHFLVSSKQPRYRLPKIKDAPKNVNFMFTGAMDGDMDSFTNAFESGSKDPFFIFKQNELQRAVNTANSIAKKFPAAGITVAGHSMGTKAAAQLADKFKDHVKQLILLDPVHPGGINTAKLHPNTYVGYPTDTVPWPYHKGETWWPFDVNNFAGINNLAALLGGRVYPEIKPGRSFTWKGDHLNGASAAMRRLMKQREVLAQLLKQKKISQADYQRKFWSFPMGAGEER